MVWKRWMQCAETLIARRLAATDTEGERRVRRLLIPVCFLIVAAQAVFLGSTRRHEFGNGVLTIPPAVGVVVFPVVILVLTRHRNPRPGVLMFQAIAFINSVCIDWYAASVDGPRLPLAVIMKDLLLLFDTPRWLTATYIALIILYLATAGLESATRFGFYEVGRFGNHLEPDTCSSPPCEIKWRGAVWHFVASVVIFLADFWVTRNFSNGMKQQNKLVSASIAVAEKVAKHLSCYSVRQARDVLAKDGDSLPPDLLAAMQTLLQNLEMYRPFLPDSIFQSVEEPDSTVQPPTGESVCICFTDIQSSTELWDASPQGMYEGLQMHNRVLRRLANMFGGFEVKTIGDAFMLAFGSAFECCCFGMAVQRQLLEEDWPEDLLSAFLCRPVIVEGGQKLWNGLRVKVGVHCGPVKVECNPITKRCDYFGRTVNVASRIESSLKAGGFVAASDDVIEAVGAAGMAALGDPVLVPQPARELKGVAGKVVINVLVPPELQQRLRHLETRSPLQRAASRLSATSSGREALRRHRSQNGQPAIQQKFKASRVSCATIRAVLPESGVESFSVSVLHAVQQAADLCEGELRSVISASCIVTWNTHTKPCELHPLLCARFLGHVAASAGRMDLHCGAASGEAQSGTLPGTRQWFATVVGGCIELSAALADEAVLTEEQALCIGPVAEHFAALGRATPVQHWHAGSDRSHSLLVWSLNLTECDTDGESKWGVLAAEERPLRRTSFTRPPEVSEGVCEDQQSETLVPSEPDGDVRRGAVRERWVPVAWGLCEK